MEARREGCIQWWKMASSTLMLCSIENSDNSSGSMLLDCLVYACVRREWFMVESMILLACPQFLDNWCTPMSNIYVWTFSMCRRLHCMNGSITRLVLLAGRNRQRGRFCFQKYACLFLCSASKEINGLHKLWLSLASWWWICLCRFLWGDWEPHTSRSCEKRRFFIQVSYQGIRWEESQGGSWSHACDGQPIGRGFFTKLVDICSFF